MGNRSNAGFGVILCLGMLAGCESQQVTRLQYREADAPLQAPENGKRTELTALPMGAGDLVGQTLFVGAGTEAGPRREGTASTGD